MHKSTVFFGWSPGIGDPTFVGWLTVVAYFGAAGLCVRAGRIGVLRTGRLVFWEFLAVILLALGVNKQLDLQEIVTGFGPYLAKDEGWYADRRPIQYISIVALASCAFIFILTLTIALRRSDIFKRTALIGITLLSVFVLVRAASFHHVDQMLGFGFGNVTVNNLLELGGIAAIAIPATLSPSSSKYISQRRSALLRANGRLRQS